MPRQPLQFRYGRSLLVAMTIYGTLLSLAAAATLLYIALVRVPASLPLLRALCVAAGFYVPVLAAQRAALYFRQITLDRQGLTMVAPLDSAFVSWSDIYVVERQLLRGGLNACYCVVISTGAGPRTVTVCDELLPGYEQLVEAIRRYAPRAQYREC